MEVNQFFQIVVSQVTIGLPWATLPHTRPFINEVDNASQVLAIHN